MISFNTFFVEITKRDTFIPPPVLPAQAPIKIRMTKIVLLVCGQRLKSVVAYPVLEIMEATWKDAFVKASKSPCDISRILKVIIPTETAIIPTG